MQVRLEVFGGARVVVEGRSLALRPQATRLLGVLLTRPDVPWTMDDLVGRLWDGSPPATAPKVVHVNVGKLRGALGADADRLATTPDGYVLHAAPVDLAEYEVARDAATTGPLRDVTRALATAERALRAWQGRPWGRLADEPWLRPRVDTLEAHHRDLEERWVDLLLECDRAAEAVEPLRLLAEAEPLRERRWALLMTALYRTGRQADALRVYERVRRVLRDELGIEPGPELRHLELAILHQDPALLRSRPSPAGVHAATSFVGREAELRALTRAVDRDRLVTVTGIGGIGKSRLVAEYLHARSLDGALVHRLSFSGVDSTERFADHAARQLGLFVDEGSDLAGILAATIGDGEQLLVVDAAEQVTDEVAHLVLTLLDRCPRLRVVVTSRLMLGVGSEREFHLGPLPTTGPDGAPGGPALTLMLDRAGLDPELLDGTTAREMGHRVARTGGVPLLVELAARRGADEPDDPVAPAAVAIADAITHALDAAEPAARTLAARAAVLPGGVTETLAARIGEVEEPDARRALRQLAWLHLIDAYPGRESVRYRSLDPVRGALLDRLDPDERADARHRAAAALQGLVDDVWPDHTAPVRLGALDPVADEHDNLRSMLADRLRHDPAAALELAIGASDFWSLRGHIVEGRDWLRKAMAAARPDGLRLARATLALVRITRTLAETADVRPLLERTVAALRDTGEDDVVLGGLVVYVAIARAWQGDRAGAGAALDEAYRLDAVVGTPWTRAHLDHLRALDAALVGDFERARDGQRHFARLMLELDDPASAATGRYLAASVGDMMGPASDLAAIRTDLAASRELAETVGDVSLLSRLLLLEARVLQRSHDGGNRAALDDAAQRLTEQGGIAAAALARRDLGLLALRDGESGEATATLRAVAPVLLRLDRPAAAPAWAGLAVLRAADGDDSVAAELAAAARTLAATSSAPQWVADRQRVDELLADLPVTDPGGTDPAVPDRRLLEIVSEW